MTQFIILQATDDENMLGALLIWGIFIVLNVKIARWKGYPTWAGVISGFILWFGTILFLIMPFNEKTRAKCPYCNERIYKDAKKCKHCGEFMDEIDSKKAQVKDDIGLMTEPKITDNDFRDPYFIKRIKFLNQWNNCIFGLSIFMIAYYIIITITIIITFNFDNYKDYVNTCDIIIFFCFAASLISYIKRVKVFDFRVKNDRLNHLAESSNNLNIVMLIVFVIPIVIILILLPFIQGGDIYDTFDKGLTGVEILFYLGHSVFILIMSSIRRAKFSEIKRIYKGDDQ